MLVPLPALGLVVLSGLVAVLAVALATLLTRAARQRADAATLDARLDAVRQRVGQASEVLRAAAASRAPAAESQPEAAAPTERRPGSRRRGRRTSASPARP